MSILWTSERPQMERILEDGPYSIVAPTIAVPSPIANLPIPSTAREFELAAAAVATWDTPNLRYTTYEALAGTYFGPSGRTTTHGTTPRQMIPSVGYYASLPHQIPNMLVLNNLDNVVADCWVRWVCPLDAMKPADRAVGDLKSILFLGDSLTMHGFWMEVRRGLRLHGRGYGGGTVASIDAAAINVLRQPYDCIVIEAGVNDMAAARTLAQFQTDMAALWASCAASSTRIVTLTVPPCNGCLNYNGPLVDSYNAWLLTPAVAPGPVIDMAAMGDGSFTLLPANDAGDHIHWLQTQTAGHPLGVGQDNAAAIVTAGLAVYA